MSFFITLVENSDSSRRAIETAPRVQGMIHKGLTLPEYRAFLRDLYHIVWHFCPIMAAAARITVAQVRETVALGELDPESVVTPGIHVQRIVRIAPLRRAA